MNNQEQAIAQLNTIIKANLGVSKVNGIGVIAVRDIKKGEKIFADKLPSIYHIPYGSIGKLFPEARKIILERWPSIVNGSKFIYPDARLVSFMNHSVAGHNYDPLTDTAECDILKGEEILENYKLMPNWEKVWPPDKNRWILNQENPESSTYGIKRFLHRLGFGKM